MSDTPSHSPVLARLKGLAPDAFENFVEDVEGENQVAVKAEKLKRVMGRLLNDEVLGAAILWDLTGLAPANQSQELELRYSLMWPEWQYRLVVRVELPGQGPRIDSVAGIWPSADWLEREVWDLYGVVFEGHPDLRRILLPEGFVGHPLRTEESGHSGEPEA